ncbi:ABC transporter substrate-binding protein [Allonocardiopsis opalescens]|uniref:Raffinose/stachyose/melibiose transport system substrate-binding protein n=1 Tax=Allonocardiopsis opalescens TaxID=1144618 RepID=A0A2T0PPC0_9ACTN|nr:extracellular solute-binding protein [Allonocardiopsis opalescens]PRX90750.1 raffinose/stachyose/melibiose transport system substrate-binding protein [Allonocardiopsis opalescens]
MRRRHRTRCLAVGTAAALTLAAAGCGGSDGADGQTLTVWHYEQEGGALDVAWDAAIEEFERTHPGVTVQLELRTFEQIQQTTGMVLNSDEAPDVMEYNKGNATAGLLSSQGLLTDLTQVAQERGWTEQINEHLSATARYDENGLMDGDTWYGIPNYGEYVLMYYNQDLFDEHGIDVPTDAAGFEAALEDFAAAGVTPIANAGGDHPAQHWLYLLALSQADQQWVRDYQFFEGEVDFHGPEWSYAAETYRDWLDRGFFDPDAVGLEGTEMTEGFVSGQYPIMVGGNWWYGGFADDIQDFEWGAVPFPGSELAPGSAGNMWVVPARSENQELAYDFIDITMSPEIQELIGDEGNIPLAADIDAIEDERTRGVVAGFHELQSTGNLAFYPDWPVAGYYDTYMAAVQNLMNGSPPHEVLDQIAVPYQEHVASLD